MAGRGWKRFTRQRLASDEVQGYLMDQTVQTWPSASARNAALGGTDLADGMVTYLADTGRLEIRHGGGWRLLKYVGAIGTSAEPAVRLTRAASNGTSIPHVQANLATRVSGWTVDKASGSFSVASDGTITVLERGKLDAWFEVTTDSTVAGVLNAYVTVSGRPTRDHGLQRPTGYAGAGLLRTPALFSGYVDAGTTVAAWALHQPSSGTPTATLSAEAELVLS